MSFPPIFKNQKKPTRNAQAMNKPGRNLYMKRTVRSSIEDDFNLLLTESQAYAI